MKGIRRTGRFAAAFCFVAMLFAFCMTAYADEGAPAPVSLVITDETGIDYDGTITIEFYNRDTAEMVHTEELTRANSWGSGKIVNFELPAGLNCGIIVRADAGISLVNTWDRTKADDNFIIFAGPNEKAWSIILAKTEGTDSVPSASGPASVSGSASSATGSSEAEITYPEAQELFEKFLAATEFMKTEDTEYVSKFVGGGRYDRSEYYAKYVRDGSVEKYNALTGYEAWVWYVTYTSAVSYYLSDMREHYYKTEEHFKQNFISTFTKQMESWIKNKEHKQAVIDAYTELMLWQYNYIKENGEVFNFINHCSYSEEMRQKRLLEEAETAAVPRDELKTEATESETKETVQETKKQEIKETEAETENQTEEQKEEKGVWSELMDSLAGSLLTILILIVLGIALAVLWFRKKNAEHK